MWIAEFYGGKILEPLSYFKHDATLQNENGQTVAMILAKNQIIPPQEWMHDIYLKDNQQHSIYSYLDDKQIPIPKHWKDEGLTIFDQAIYNHILDISNHNSKEQNEEGWTIAMILAFQNKSIPQEWVHKPQLRNKYGYTVAIYQALNGKIPLKIWEYEEKIRNNKNQTYQDILNQQTTLEVQEDISCHCESSDQQLFKKYLLENNIKTDDYEHFNINFNKNQNKETFAMYLVRYKIIPRQEYFNNQYLKNKDGKTLQQLFYDNYLPYPSKKQDSYYNKAIFREYMRDFEYCVDYQQDNNFTLAMIFAITNENTQYLSPRSNFIAEKQNDYGYTTAMYLAQNKEINIDQYPKANHDPIIQNIDGNTVAMILAMNNKQIPEQWMHDKGIKNKANQTVFDICVQHNRVPPKEWCFDPTYKKDGMTQAMILASKNIDIPKYLYHDPTIVNSQGKTVAMLIAEHGKIPPKQWEHSKYITYIYSQYYRRNYIDTTYQGVDDILKNKNQFVPEQWDRSYIPQFIKQAQDRIIPTSANYEQDKYYKDKDGNTVAMILAEREIIPPQQWCHNPTLQNNQHQTVAMILAQHSIIPPKEWEYTDDCYDKDYNNVAMLLAKNGIMPPKQWLQCIKCKCNSNNTCIKAIKQSLQNNKQIYYLTDNIGVIQENNACVVCLQESKQQFVLTKCNHRVCKDCYEELKKQQKAGSCPQCRSQDWIKLLSDQLIEEFVNTMKN